MFSKCLGAAETESIMRSLAKLGIDEQLEYILKMIKESAERFCRIEVICKNGLSKASSEGEQVKFDNNFYVGKKDTANTNPIKPILKKLGVEIEDWSCNIVYHALFDAKEVEIAYLPEKHREDVNKLQGAAKKECKQFKSAHQKIVNDLKKIKILFRKIETIVNKIMSENMAKGLMFDDSNGEMIESSPNYRTFIKLKKEYENLVSKLCRLKFEIRSLLIDCELPKEVAGEIFNSIKYPTFDAGKLRKMKK